MTGKTGRQGCSGQRHATVLENFHHHHRNTPVKKFIGASTSVAQHVSSYSL
jgi:hypothetical protein